MPGTVGTFKQDHHIVFGAALVGVGVFGIIGSLTGRLAVMLAALFDPGSLSTSSSTGPSVPAIPGAPPDTTPGEPGGQPKTPIEPGAPGLPAVPTPEVGGGGGGILGGLSDIGKLFELGA